MRRKQLLTCRVRAILPILGQVDVKHLELTDNCMIQRLVRYAFVQSRAVNEAHHAARRCTSATYPVLLPHLSRGLGSGYPALHLIPQFGDCYRPVPEHDIMKLADVEARPEPALRFGPEPQDLQLSTP